MLFCFLAAGASADELPPPELVTVPNNPWHVPVHSLAPLPPAPSTRITVKRVFVVAGVAAAGLAVWASSAVLVSSLNDAAQPHHYP